MAEPRSRKLRLRLDAARERLAARREELESGSEDFADTSPSQSAGESASQSASGPGEVHVVVEPSERHYGAERGHPVSYGMRAAADWSWRLLVVAGAVALVGFLAWEFRVVVFPVFAAMLIAAGLAGPVQRLRRRGWNRALSAVTVFLLFLVVVSGSLTMVGNVVGDQFEDVVTQAQEGLQEIRDWLAGPPFNIDEAQHSEWIERATSLVQDNQGDITEGAAAAAGIALEIVIGILLMLFALVFLLYDGDRMWAWAVGLLPASVRARGASLGTAAWQTLGQYVRGIVLVAVFDAVGIVILLLILQVPLAIPLGVLVFFGAFVPFVGAFVTGALAVLVALVTQGLVAAVIVLIGIIVIQQLEGNVFQPLILGRMVRLHPLAVVLAVTVGSLAGGIIGAVVAVPIVAVLNTVIKHQRSQSGPDTPAVEVQSEEPSPPSQ